MQRYYAQPMSEKRGSYDRAVAEEVTSVPKEVPKPYTTPKGYVPPSIGEQFRYVRCAGPSPCSDHFADYNHRASALEQCCKVVRERAERHTVIYSEQHKLAAR